MKLKLNKMLCVDKERNIVIFEKTWHAVRGDSGVSLSAAMSGLMSAIFIANLNLKTIKKIR